MVSSYFLLKNRRPVWGEGHRPLEVTTFSAVVSLPLLSSHVVYPVFFLNSAKKIMLFGCQPLDGVTHGGLSS